MLPLLPSVRVWLSTAWLPSQSPISHSQVLSFPFFSFLSNKYPSFSSQTISLLLPSFYTLCLCVFSSERYIKHMLVTHNQNFPLLSLSLSGLFHKCTVLFCSEGLLGVGLLTCWAECAAKSLPWESEREQRAGHRTALCHRTLCQPWLEHRCTDWREKTNCNCSTEVVIDVKTYERKWVRKRDSFTPAFLPSAPGLPCLSPGVFPWFIHLFPGLQHLSYSLWPLPWTVKSSPAPFPLCFQSPSLHPALLLLSGNNLFSPSSSSLPARLNFCRLLQLKAQDLCSRT